MDSSFKHQFKKDIVFVLLQNASLLGEKKHHVDDDYSVRGARHFQGPGLLQHCCSKGDEYHTATAFYLTTLYKKGMGLTQAAVHHGTNDQSRKNSRCKRMNFWLLLSIYSQSRIRPS
jgi:hypothetical protein